MLLSSVWVGVALNRDRSTSAWRVGWLPLVAALALFLPLGALAQAAEPQAAGTQDSPELQPGVIIPRVECAQEPEQTYALYLPSSFSRDRIWPVVFALDPAARGSVPVELMKGAAEKYGYIVAGSNNSRNGPFTPSYRAAAAMAQDVSRRFPVDGKRVYFTGFSGAARAAVVVAKLCQGCAAGVILHGAGFPSDPNYRPDKSVSFAVFSAIGALDFNYSEVIPLQEKFDELGITHRLRRFDGPHQWAPSEVWMEAVEWLDLMAMKQGSVQPNQVFIAQQLAKRMAWAGERETAGDLYAAWQEYRDIARDFAGLSDTADATARAAALASDPKLLAARDAEHEEMEEERDILRGFERAFARMQAATSDLIEARVAVESELDALRRRREAEKDKDGAASPVIERTFTQVSARLFEGGDQARREKDYFEAVVHFELWSKLLAGQPAPFYHLGRTYAASGKKKEALKALRKAVELGFNRPEFLSHEDFAALQSDPEFAKLRQEAEKKRNANADERGSNR